MLELVASGKIATAEGDELLKGLAAPRGPAWRWLINPFDLLGVVPSLPLGLAGALGALVLSRWNVRFDGALDVHVVPWSVSFREFLLEQIVAWPVTAAFLWLAARVLARQTRVTDVLGSVGVARLPLLVVGAAAAARKDRLLSGEIDSASPVLIILATLTVPAVTWTITLLFQGKSPKR